MTKTRLLLAFGRHGNAGKGMGPMQGNKQFFKNAAKDFADSQREHIVIIHEQGPMLGMESSSQISKLMDVWSSLNAFRGFVERREEAIAGIEPKRAYLENVMNMQMCDAVVGIPGNTLEIGIDGDMNDPFGMIAFARESPEHVKVLVERQSGEAYYLGVLHGILEKALSLRMDEHHGEWSEKDVEIMVEFLKVSAKLGVHRDRNVISQINAMADANPEGIFIVPRGYGHRHMAKIVDDSRFDVTLKEDAKACLGFEDDVLSMSYSQELEDAKLRMYSELNLDYEVEIKRLWGSFMREVGRILEAQGLFEEWSVAEEKIANALNGISKKAREFALSNESRRKQEPAKC